MLKKFQILCFGFFLMVLSTLSHAQDADRHGIDNIGLGFQMYPAGTMLNLRMGWPVSTKGLFIAKLGYNRAERQDFGEHDEEDGGGPGITAAYKRYFKEGYQGLFLEGRLSAWFLDIDWRDNNPAVAGNTDITVLQPTIALGYDFLLKGEKIKLGLFAAAGYEINIITSGQEVGQGGISIGGASFSFRLQ